MLWPRDTSDAMKSGLNGAVPWRRLAAADHGRLRRPRLGVDRQLRRDRRIWLMIRRSSGHIPVGVSGRWTSDDWAARPRHESGPGFHLPEARSWRSSSRQTRFRRDEPKGRLVYGIGIGLDLAIRTWGRVDGVAFAVLLMNMAVPLLTGAAHRRSREDRRAACSRRAYAGRHRNVPRRSPPRIN